MARTRNEDTYLAARDKLLDVAQNLFRERSYGAVGLKDILEESSVPKGSFYHYFDSKESFGIAVAQHYHERELEKARAFLTDPSLAPVDRLRAFFEGARAEMKQREFAHGCLMCNLTTELADERPEFQEELASHWRAMVETVADCLRDSDLDQIGLAHLTPEQAADWLMNSWSGALTRMKASRSDEPLALFMRTIFKS
ncbi:TetR family transcriptional regulator C-terminal domain-containing protein [Labrenzia aggregata]|uniref:TetR family transcriptional regulator C-terminal domain-containing protein n=1 Tax=Roseibium aggregatum TaxID=187304 RepID=A0A939EI72_9HYPH|nr:TetR family transcriptional regulator C-terminal domain-containing protein [Roseibium aggregatum]